MRFKLLVFVFALAASSLAFGQYTSYPAWQYSTINSSGYASTPFNANTGQVFNPTATPQTFVAPAQPGPPTPGWPQIIPNPSGAIQFPPATPGRHNISVQALHSAPRYVVPPVTQFPQPSYHQPATYIQPFPQSPCGPDWLPAPLRGIVHQGFLGADFRPACNSHDACYTWPGWSRSACDRRYLNQMLRSCDSSLWPAGCRMKARLMHSSVRLFGSNAYRVSRPWPGY